MIGMQFRLPLNLVKVDYSYTLGASAKSRRALNFSLKLIASRLLTTNLRGLGKSKLCLRSSFFYFGSLTF